MSRVSTVSKHLDIKPDIQGLTMQMLISKVCSTVPGRSSATRTIDIAAGGYAISGQAQVAYAAQYFFAHVPTEP